MEEHSFRQGRILIVDDQPANILLLEMTFQQGGFTNIRSTTDPHAVLSIFAEFQPDILLLDLHMPGLTGFEVMEQLRAVVGKNTYFPILVLTANAMSKVKQQALVYGAKDFLTKPFDLTEVLLRTKNLIETRFLHLELQNQNRILDVKVRERTRDLEMAQVEILQRLSQAAEFRDDVTGQHTQRVGRLSALLARALGLTDEQVQLIRLAAPLHDVGKIGIADAILLKPGPLTPEEFQVIVTHTRIGAEILSGSQSPLLQLAEQIALAHHECWDGSGYPRGCRGEAIPFAGRIVSVVDVFDALTHPRPYKPAWPPEEAALEVARLSGSKFDPRVVDAFLQLFRDGLLQDDAKVGDSIGASIAGRDAFRQGEHSGQFAT